MKRRARRMEFLRSLFDCDITPLIPTPNGFREIEDVDELAAIEASARANELFYWCRGLPVVGADRARFKGPLPLGANLVMDGMLAGTEVAAYRVTLERS